MTVQTTVTSAQPWRPDLNTFAPSDVVPDALVLQTSIVAGNVEGDQPSVRVAYVEDDAADFVAEAEEIDEADPALAEVVVFTGKVSQLIRLSREQYQQNRTPDLLSESVRRAVTNRANAAYLTQPAPVGPATTPPAGILTHADIIDGGTIDENLDTLTDAFAAIEGNGGNPTHILAAPDAWGFLRKFKTGTEYNSTLLGAGTNDTDRRLLGVQVVVTPAMNPGALAVLDRGAVVSAVGPVMVSTSHDRYFEFDSIGLRCTWRFGANLVRPDRVATLTVADPTGS